MVETKFDKTLRSLKCTRNMYHQSDERYQTILVFLKDHQYIYGKNNWGKQRSLLAAI